MRWALLIALLIAAGCRRSEIIVSELPRVQEASLERGVISYGDVLARLGPPSEIYAQRDGGFAFGYLASRYREGNVTLSYSYGKVAYSSGNGQQRRLVLFFDGRGLLLSAAQNERPLDVGYGALVGHSLLDEPFYGAYNYAPQDLIHRDGALMLRPHPGPIIGRPVPPLDIEEELPPP